MRILVDADACPVKSIIINVAKEYNIPVVMFIDTSHNIKDRYSEVIVVDKQRDSVDIALVNRVSPGDVVVTQDFGLAAMVLGKKGTAINQNGMIYSDGNMDMLLFERYLSQKIRRAGGRTAGQGKRKKEDDEKFEVSFRKILKQQTD